jgi:hypothetical protein
MSSGVIRCHLELRHLPIQARAQGGDQGRMRVSCEARELGCEEVWGGVRGGVGRCGEV